jgi:hypothetical protein
MGMTEQYTGKPAEKAGTQQAKNPRHRLAGLGGFFTTIRGQYV